MNEEKERVWKEVKATIWKPKQEGDNIIGYLMHKEEGNENVSARYYLNVEEPEGTKEVMIWGSTVLDERMKLVNIGDYLKLTYVEQKKTKQGRTVNIWKVEVAEALR